MKKVLSYTLAPLPLLLGMLSAQGATLNISAGLETPIPANQVQAVSNEIATVMRDIANARNALQQHDGIKAKNELLDAQNTLKAMEDVYGASVLAMDIMPTHHDSSLNAQNTKHKADMRPLKELKQTKAALLRGQFSSAEKIVDGANYPLTFAEIDLPLAKTYTNINQAIRLTSQGKLESANTLLDSTQDNTVSDSGIFSDDF